MHLCYLICVGVRVYVCVYLRPVLCRCLGLCLSLRYFLRVIVLCAFAGVGVCFVSVYL